MYQYVLLKIVPKMQVLLRIAMEVKFPSRALMPPGHKLPFSTWRRVRAPGSERSLMGTGKWFDQTNQDRSHNLAALRASSPLEHSELVYKPVGLIDCCISCCAFHAAEILNQFPHFAFWLLFCSKAPSPFCLTRWHFIKLCVSYNVRYFFIKSSMYGRIHKKKSKY